MSNVAITNRLTARITAHSRTEGLSEMPNTLKLGELFCGPGGMGHGALTASGNSCGRKPRGFEHAFATDYDADACATYERNLSAKEKRILVGDIRSFDISTLPHADCLAFGFPCNDFSVVGEQRGVSGSFGPLYTYGVKYLESHGPACFVAENVGGLQSANDGKAFEAIIAALKGAGYCITAHLYGSEDYGVPQRRRRIILVGIRADLGLRFQVPEPPTGKNPPTVRTCLIDNPIPSWAPNQERTRQSPVVVERLKHIRPGENAFNANLPEQLRLNVQGARISQIYRRLDPEQPSYTITGSGGGGTHVYHWSEPRALTNRERARLQGFPDDYEFVGSKESVRKQIGMAVPPPLSRAVFSALLNTLAGRQYPSVPANIDLGEIQPGLALERRNAYREALRPGAH